MNGHAEIVEALLRLGPIYESARQSAITQIRHIIEDQHVRESLLNLLESAPSISDDGGPPLQDTLLVNLDEVKANPEEVLKQLSLEGIPRRVTLTDNPLAIDFRGVTKQFLTTLFAACLDKRLFSIDDIGLPQVITLSGREHLTTVAKIFNQLEIRNKNRNDRFLIGELFGAPFYYLVKMCIELPESDDEELLIGVALCSLANPLLALPARVLLNPESGGCIQDYKCLLRLDTDEECLESAKEYLTGYVEGVRAFTGVLDPELKRLFSSKTPEELQVYFQGEPCTVEALLAALKVGERQELGFIQKIEWLKEKIRSSDLEWRKRFVSAITGNQTLNPNKKISILPSHREWAFEVHTCFNSLDIPKEAMTQETFLNLLDYAIAYRGYNAV